MSLKDYHDLLIELRNENISYKQIAERLGYKRDTIKHYCQKNNIRGIEIDNSIETREQNYIKRFVEKFPNFEYVSGFNTYDSKIKIKCKTCGHIQERHANSNCERIMICDNCVELERIERRVERLKAKQIEKANKVRKENEYTETICVECSKTFLRAGNNQRYCSNECYTNAHKVIHNKICKECGNSFNTYHDGNLYCSDKCRRKCLNRMHTTSKDKRIRRNGKPDYSISLKKLYNMHKGICYICGKQCNPKDIEITEEGYYIAGESYPSIDHVIPIAKGGTHTWDNVKLAHRHCNSVKRDSIFYQEDNRQFRIF